MRINLAMAQWYAPARCTPSASSLPPSTCVLNAGSIVFGPAATGLQRGLRDGKEPTMLDLHLVVSARYAVPQRVMAPCCRRRGAVLALTFQRGGPDGTAALELTVDVEPRL